MQVNIKPWQPGDKGLACLPLKENIPAPEASKHPDWKLVLCPICGAECWESDLARQVKAQGVTGACTRCAITIGAGGNPIKDK